MHSLRKTRLILASVLGLSFSATGAAAQDRAEADPPVQAQQAEATISITDFIYSPDALAVKVGQPITITNTDGFIHSVTAKDGTFNVDVPQKGSVKLTVPKAGSFAYSCVYHPGSHNPATINVS